jgi:hypothetical protein
VEAAAQAQEAKGKGFRLLTRPRSAIDRTRFQGEGKRARRLLGALLLAVSSLVASPPPLASAQTDSDKATARELAKEGADALEKKDFAKAADRFARADALFHAPTLLLGLARAQVGLGKLVAAQENYHSILREELTANAPEAFIQAAADARKELAALTPQVPWVILSVEGAKDLSQAKVKIGADAVPPAALGVKRAIDPGEHTLRVELKGYLPAEKKFTVAPGVTESVTITLVPAPSDVGAPPKGTAAPVEPPPSSGLFRHQDVVGIVLLGVGSAGAVVGAVTGVLALQKHSDLEAGGCTAEGCPASQQEALGSYHTLGTLSTAGFITGGVGLAAGLVLVLTAPKGPKKSGADATTGLGPVVRPYIGAGEIGVVGRF